MTLLGQGHRLTSVVPEARTSHAVVISPLAQSKLPVR
jgi:hypothetical protein